MKIGLLGCAGRMGKAITALTEKGHPCHIVAGSTRPGGTLPTVPYRIYTEALPVFQEAEVVMDFSHHSALAQHAALAAATGKPLLVGTTGHISPVEDIVAEARVPLLYAQNTSASIPLLVRTVEAFCKKCVDLPLYDVCLVETHRRDKKDAPSGTALWLHRTLCRLLEGLLGAAPVIPISSVRRGTEEGTHQIIFTGPYDYFEFSHKGSLPLFATGALRMAQWLVSQAPGLYTMDSWLQHC